MPSVLPGGNRLPLKVHGRSRQLNNVAPEHIYTPAQICGCARTAIAAYRATLTVDSSFCSSTKPQNATNHRIRFCPRCVKRPGHVQFTSNKTIVPGTQQHLPSRSDRMHLRPSTRYKMYCSRHSPKGPKCMRSWTWLRTCKLWRARVSSSSACTSRRCKSCGQPTKHLHTKQSRHRFVAGSSVATLKTLNPRNRQRRRLTSP